MSSMVGMDFIRNELISFFKFFESSDTLVVVKKCWKGCRPSASFR